MQQNQKISLSPYLWPLVAAAFVENAVEIHVYHFAVLAVKQNVFAVSVTQADQVTDHAHDGSGTDVARSRLEPGVGVREVAKEPQRKDRLFEGRED